MKFIIFLLMMNTSVINPIMIFDFSSSCSMSSWFVTNDNVMGGVSSSKIRLNDKGNGEFYGAVSTKNNGGFAMARMITDISLNGNSTKIVLRVKGDGKRYQLRIKGSSKQKYWYVHAFETTNNWQIIELPLKEFFASYRGYKLGIENFSEDQIKELAILIGNKRSEQFKLEIDWIKVY